MESVAVIPCPFCNGELCSAIKNESGEFFIRKGSAVVNKDKSIPYQVCPHCNKPVMLKVTGKDQYRVADYQLGAVPSK